jgi:hypothetical protein
LQGANAWLEHCQRVMPSTKKRFLPTLAEPVH